MAGGFLQQWRKRTELFTGTIFSSSETGRAQDEVLTDFRRLCHKIMPWLNEIFPVSFPIKKRITVGVMWIARNFRSNQSFETYKNLPDGTGKITKIKIA